MSGRNGWWTCLAAVAVATLAGVGSVEAQLLDEGFDGVSGTGGGVFILDGSGFFEVGAWDDGLLGEGAFGGTIGSAVVGSASAYGDVSGGVGGGGAGVIDVSGVSFNDLRENFDAVTGVGGGDFVSDSSGHNTTDDWDDGIGGENAFAGVVDGATLGTASAQGLPTGGVGGGAGQILVENVNLGASGDWYAGLDWDTPLPAGSLKNPSFEEYYDWYGDRPDGWAVWGNAYSVAADPGMGLVPRTGNRMMKMWGNWENPWNTQAVVQEFDSVEGDVWEIDCYTKHISTNGSPAEDNLVGTENFVLMKIEFMDEEGGLVGFDEVTVLDQYSPLDVWIDHTPLQATAPAGTARVKALFMFLQPNYEGGAAQIDDASFTKISGDPALDISDVTLTADIKGEAVSGQSLGDYVLRLEDSDGDAMSFPVSATGVFQSIGGVLASATETAGDSATADGVFNPNSPYYRVAVAFADEAATWGTGGMLTIDNLLLSTGGGGGAGWYAGLYWDELIPTTGADQNQMLVLADVLGDVTDGDYLMRVEGFTSVTVPNVDEDFETVTGVGGGWFLEANTSGLTSAGSSDWDTGIEGEGAFGGIFGDGAEIFTGGGFAATGLISGGVGGGGAGEIRVESIIYGPGDGWYAGINWTEQTLPAAELSEITLTADIKGTIASGGTLGDYELRIEDAQNDRLYFAMTADGNWQSVGGTLDIASNGPALDGGGDGTFDLNSPSYKVGVAFSNEAATWAYGGSLTVDNLYLSAADVRHEIGRTIFYGTADETFQTIGGVMSAGESTFGSDTAEDFAGATGVGGGQFFTPGGGGYVDDWDTGISGEEAFAGIWGDAAILGGMTAEACLDCGVDGGAAGRLIVDDIYVGSNGWYAGLSFVDVHAVLYDLDEVSLTADIKGTADTGAGQTLGTYMFRIEDPQLDYLGFEVLADGTFQSVGGTLSSATSGSIGGDGVFDRNAEYYHIVLVATGDAGNWGSGGTLVIDNIVLDGIGFADAEEYTVVVTFDNEASTWGNEGSLTVDNLFLGRAANCDGDADVDLRDFAAFQRCFTDDGGGVLAGCECTDLDEDGDVDLADYELFLLGFEGPK